MLRHIMFRTHKMSHNVWSFVKTCPYRGQKYLMPLFSIDHKNLPRLFSLYPYYILQLNLNLGTNKGHVGYLKQLNPVFFNI